METMETVLSNCMKSAEVYIEWKEFHYFANTADTWATGKGLLEVIQKLKDCCASHCTKFNLWIIPVDESETYDIKGYVPLVDGAVYLGMHKF